MEGVFEHCWGNCASKAKCEVVVVFSVTYYMDLRSATTICWGCNILPSKFSFLFYNDQTSYSAFAIKDHILKQVVIAMCDSK